MRLNFGAKLGRNPRASLRAELSLDLRACLANVLIPLALVLVGGQKIVTYNKRGGGKIRGVGEVENVTIDVGHRNFLFSHLP